MGLNKDLKLQANEFSNVATAFFATYLIAEIPTGKSVHHTMFDYSQIDLV
jgi:hypothetical protein